MRALVSILVLVAALAPSVGEAQSREDRRRAHALFTESVDHYREGRFSVAAELLREAIALHPAPTLRYNLARALEGMGDVDGAIEEYQRYLSEADEIEDRGAIERRLQTLKEQRDERRRLEELAAADRGEPEAREVVSGTASDVAEDADAAEEERGAEGGGPSALPWIVTGVGVATIGVGLVVGGLASTRNDEALAEPVHERAVAFRSEAEDLALVANVLFVVGGVAAAAGIVWGILDLTSADGDDEVEVGLGPGSVAIRGRF